MNSLAERIFAMGTSFYIQKKGDSDGQRLHVCRRSGRSWKFQGVYPSADFVRQMGKDTNVYYFADEYENLLPEGIKAITAVDDWLYVLRNLPNGVELVDDNCSGETAIELADLIEDVCPVPLDEVLDREYVSDDPVFRAIDQSMRQDDFVDRYGWRFTYRIFF